MGQPGPYNVNLSGLEAECQWAKGAFSEKFGRFRAGGSGGMTRRAIGGTDNAGRAAGRFGLAQPGIDGGVGDLAPASPVQAVHEACRGRWTGSLGFREQLQIYRNTATHAATPPEHAGNEQE